MKNEWIYIYIHTLMQCLSLLLSETKKKNYSASACFLSFNWMSINLFHFGALVHFFLILEFIFHSSFKSHLNPRSIYIFLKLKIKSIDDHIYPKASMSYNDLQTLYFIYFSPSCFDTAVAIGKNRKLWKAYICRWLHVMHDRQPFLKCLQQANNWVLNTKLASFWNMQLLNVSALQYSLSS